MGAGIWFLGNDWCHGVVAGRVNRIRNCEILWTIKYHSQDAVTFYRMYINLLCVGAQILIDGYQ